MEFFKEESPRMDHQGKTSTAKCAGQESQEEQDQKGGMEPPFFTYQTTIKLSL